jgi:hypothetical protein
LRVDAGRGVHDEPPLRRSRSSRSARDGS